MADRYSFLPPWLVVHFLPAIAIFFLMPSADAADGMPCTHVKAEVEEVFSKLDLHSAEAKGLKSCMAAHRVCVLLLDGSLFSSDAPDSFASLPKNAESGGPEAYIGLLQLDSRRKRICAVAQRTGIIPSWRLIGWRIGDQNNVSRLQEFSAIESKYDVRYASSLIRTMASQVEKVRQEKPGRTKQSR